MKPEPRHRAPDLYDIGTRELRRRRQAAISAYGMRVILLPIVVVVIFITLLLAI